MAKKTNKKPGPNPGIANLKPPWSSTNQPGNQGRPKLSDIERSVRYATKLEISELMADIQTMSPEEIVNAVKSNRWNGNKALIAKAYLQDFKRGELKNWEIVLNRIIGKPKQDIDLRVEEVPSFSPEELARMIEDEQL